MDKIYIENLEFIGYHGVFEEEKKLGQKFLISLELFLDTRKAGVTGNLEYSTHYGFISDEVEKIFFSQSFDLIETLAEKIGEGILKKFNLVEMVKVRVDKPWAPIQKNFKTIAIEIIRKRNKVFLSLGTNIGDLNKNLNTAIENISKLNNTTIKKISSFLITKPFGNVKQDDFLNCCLEIETLLYPQELLNEVLEIEKIMGRVREVKWGPRIIDIDILFFNDEIIQDDNLSIPHPWIPFRSFVLEPLKEIAPNYIHPLEKKSISILSYLLNKEGENNEK